MKLFVIILWLFFSNNSKAQVALDTATYKKQIANLYDSMYLAFENKEYNEFSKYHHPNLKKILGGDIKYIAFIKKTLQDLGNFSINNKQLDSIFQFRKYKTTLQCLIKSSSEMLIEDKTVAVITIEYAVSFNNGKFWYFLNIDDDKTRALMVMIAPEIDPKLRLPAGLMELGTTAEELRKKYTFQYPKRLNPIIK